MRLFNKTVVVTGTCGLLGQQFSGLSSKMVEM